MAFQASWNEHWQRNGKVSDLGTGVYTVKMGLFTHDASFTIDLHDLENLHKYFGVKNSCNKFAEILSNVARDNGSCIRFSCETKKAHQLKTGNEDSNESNTIFLNENIVLDEAIK